MKLLFRVNRRLNKAYLLKESFGQLLDYNRPGWARRSGIFLFLPLLAKLRFDRIVTRLNVIQHGHIHVYILYVTATLIALLIWESL